MPKEHVQTGVYSQKSSEKQTSSPLWLRAVEHYSKELDESGDYQDMIEVRSLEALLDHTKTIEQLLPPEHTVRNLKDRLETRLKFVDGFSATIAPYLVANANLTGFIWGSIRLMLTLASSAGDVLQDTLDMLEELSFALPSLRVYESNLPLSRTLEADLLDVFTELICFYARAIKFFRIHPHVSQRRDAWGGFRKDFERTVHRMQRLSSTIESEDLARMQQDKVAYKEVLGLVERMKDSKIKKTEGAPCYHIPLEPNPRFWGREEALQAVSDALHPGEEGQLLKTFCSIINIHDLVGAGANGDNVLSP